MYRSGRKQPKSQNVYSSTSFKILRRLAHSVSWRSGRRIANGSRRSSSQSHITPRYGRRVSLLGLRRYRSSTLRGREMEIRTGRSFLPKLGSGEAQASGSWYASDHSRSKSAHSCVDCMVPHLSVDASTGRKDLVGGVHILCAHCVALRTYQIRRYKAHRCFSLTQALSRRWRVSSPPPAPGVFGSEG